VRVSYSKYLLSLTLFYSPCYKRRFQKKNKDEIVLSSGDEDDVMEIKPKLEDMKPCCSSLLKD
jgi:hypothetical protein